MQRTTVMLPATLKTRAQRLASAKGISFGELVREALERVLRSAPASELEDPLFADDAVFEGDVPSDLAARHDDYLYGSTG